MAGAGRPPSSWTSLLDAAGASCSCRCWNKDAQDEDLDDAAGGIQYMSHESIKSIRSADKSDWYGSFHGSFRSTHAVRFSSQNSLSFGSWEVDQVAEPNTLNSLKLLSWIKGGLKEWHRSVVDSLAPLEVEMERGVRVLNSYDYYDASTRRLEQMQMTGDVVHIRDSSRLRKASVLGHKQAGSDDEVLHQTSTRSLPVRKRAGAMELQACKSDVEARTKSASSKPPLPRALSARWQREPDAEVATNWGVLVAKVIHSKVLDFRAATMQVITDRRLELLVKQRRVARTVIDRAGCVLKQAQALVQGVAMEARDCFDDRWNSSGLLAYLFSEEYVDTLMLVANAARKMIASQPVLVEASVPCRIYGDLHGQLRDLLLLFHAYGFPSKHSGPDFVFNGDFVDRGKHQLEVVGLLFALKVVAPDKVWLVRGNHEDRAMSEKYGFKLACTKAMGEFGPMVYESIHKCFDQLPVACRVGQRILVMHGGIGEGRWTLSDVRQLERPIGGDQINDPKSSWIYNILWSDPIEDDAEGAQGVFGVHESPRTLQAKQFAWNVTKTFCARNGLGLIVRSHQSKHGSLGFDVMHDNLLMRVFSARDYEAHGNDGAVLLVSWHEEKQLLQVKPQVLRSLTKSRAESAAGGFETDKRS